MLLPPFLFPFGPGFTFYKVFFGIRISNIFLPLLLVNENLVKLLFKFVFKPRTSVFKWEITACCDEGVSLRSLVGDEVHDVLTIHQVLFGVYQGACQPFLLFFESQCSGLVFLFLLF